MSTPQWEHGKRVTLSHYAHKLYRKAEQFNHKFYLPLYFEQMIGDKKEVKIADLGAGIFCTIGSLWDTAKVRVYASDLLADDFNKLLKEHNITPLIPIEKQDMEHLTYPNGMFDIVHCVNAIDHCSDPLSALSEMYRVCKRGGWIYLRHYSNVGERQQYCGLHQWNIEFDGVDDCKFWNNGNRFMLGDLFKGFKTHLGREFAYEKKNMVISIMQKPV